MTNECEECRRLHARALAAESALAEARAESERLAAALTGAAAELTLASRAIERAAIGPEAAGRLALKTEQAANRARATLNALSQPRSDSLSGGEGEGRSETAAEAFLDHIANRVDYWAALPDFDPAMGKPLSIRDRCDGVAFSILLALDQGGYRLLDEAGADITAFSLHDHPKRRRAAEPEGVA